VRGAVEAGVRVLAATDLDEHRAERILTRPDAQVVVAVRGRRSAVLTALVAGAGGEERRDAVAVLPVADLVREGDVVAVRSPRVARVLVRGRVHRVEAVRDDVAARARR